MILIFSRPTDETTIQLIQWLNSINKEFFRINTIKDFDLCNINNGISTFSNKFREVTSNEFKSYYFHGGYLTIDLDEIKNKDIANQIKGYIENEIQALFESIIGNINTTKEKRKPYRKSNRKP